VITSKNRYQSMVAWSVGISILIMFFTGCSDNKKTGVYQYERKADKHIEENRYDQAIYILHEGYETYPESEKMLEKLTSGYIRYARFLDGKGEIDEAIKKMETAREMDEKNKAAMQELSYLYAKKSVEESSDQKTGEALELSLKAVDTAMRSKKVRKNTAIYFHNRAIEALQKNDDRTVLLCLNASYVLRTSFEVLDLLGLYYYQKNDLERALFYWEKAVKIDPEREGINEKIEKVRREIAFSGSKSALETEYFNVQFYGDHNLDAEKLSKTLEQVYDEVGNDLGFYPPKNTPIVFYKEKDFRNIFKQPGIVRAFYDGSGIRISINVDIDDPVFPSIVAHEYTHAVISMMTNNECPIWLHEGVAVFEQARYTKLSLLYLMGEIKKGKTLTLEEVNEGFSEKTDSQKIALSYEAAYTAVLVILDKWGWDGLRGLMHNMGRGMHYANAMDEEFYISREGFESIWNEYLKKLFLDSN